MSLPGSHLDVLRWITLSDIGPLGEGSPPDSPGPIAAMSGQTCRTYCTALSILLQLAASSLPPSLPQIKLFPPLTRQCPGTALRGGMQVGISCGSGLPAQPWDCH